MHTFDYKTPEDFDGLLVSPLRDPAKVYGTWYARYGCNYLMDPDHPKSMESSWRAMAALDRIFDIFYLPVDLPVRDERLQALSELLGKPLETDWEPVASYKPGKPRSEPPERDLDWIYALPMVREFYA